MNLLKSRINDESFARNLTRGRNSGCHGFEVFDKAVSSWLDDASEEHGLTEDGKTVPPIYQYIPFQTHFVPRNETILSSRRFIRPDSPSH